MKHTAGPLEDARVPGVLLAHERVLGRRLLLHARARYLVAVAIVVGAVVAERLVGIRGLDVSSLVLLACFVAVYNTVIRGLTRPRCDPERADRERTVLRVLLLTSIVLDYLALTVTIWLLGGARSPFLAFYLFHVVISSFFLSARAAGLSAALAIICLASLVLGQFTGLIPAPAPVGLVDASPDLDGRFVTSVLAVYSALFVLTSLLVINLNELLRASEMANQVKSRQVERLSTLRSDFLLTAAHDIGSPVGVITMLLRNLREGLCGPLEPAQTDQLERALRHLDALDQFLQELRILSQLDSADIDAQSTEIPVALLLEQVVDEQLEAARARGQTLRIVDADGTAIVRG
ncbi:MAG: hypothetical protein K8E66_10865, partial [Phycisphaerales bacterium]|nr:hypothetical protein [Phycisphaerales bacterium]